MRIFFADLGLAASGYSIGRFNSNVPLSPPLSIFISPSRALSYGPLLDGVTIILEDGGDAVGDVRAVFDVEGRLTPRPLPLPS
jgi:hypothetical protein